MSKHIKEKKIEYHLRHYNTYRVGIVNCEKQLEYIMPNITPTYDFKSDGSFIANSTAQIALDRIESLRALELYESIKKFSLICESIENAFKELKPLEQDFVKLRYFDCEPMQYVTNTLGYAEEKSVYRIRRHTLDKLLISLKNLLDMEK